MLRWGRGVQVASLFVLLVAAAAFSRGFVLSEITTPETTTDIDVQIWTTSSNSRRLLQDESSNELQNYPEDAFTKDQRSSGGFILHLMGSCYMFCLLALVCDEFFVPSLEAIADKLELSDDVAGATFLAAGGSAPELATAFMGTFVSKSDVGFGTIVGSAVFNILFVIGACAWFSSGELVLTWWPLFRDTVYYCVSLGVLIALFYDHTIEAWEAAMQLLMYVLYVLIMCFNSKLERSFKAFLTRCFGSPVEPVLDMQTHIADDNNTNMHSSQKRLPEHIHTRTTIEDSKTHNRTAGVIQSSKFPLQNIPEHDPDSHLKARRTCKDSECLSDLKTDASYMNLKVSSCGDTTTEANVPIGIVKLEIDTFNTGRTSSYTLNSPMSSSPTSPNLASPLYVKGPVLMNTHASEIKESTQSIGHNQASCDIDHPDSSIQAQDDAKRQEMDCETEASFMEEPEEEPLDISFPKSTLKRIAYIALSPLLFSLYFTVPDVRRPGSKDLYVLGFCMSIFWIGVASYLMVWWITVVGDALGIPSSIMGLTILAIGTSVPDLLESVIVAKQGKGDMAVSSSLGSNIFDATVGLPLPWLLYNLAYQQPVEVGTDGLFVSVVMLFAMLACCVSVIAMNGWKMTKSLGVAFFVFWVLFLSFSLMNEYLFS